MTQLRRRWLFVLVHAGALLPLAWLLLDWYTNKLSANPIQEATLRTGKAALVLLILSLACTPLNTVFGLRQALTFRKWLGLYAFFYVGVHFLIFIGLDYGFNFDLIMEAIFEKKYALVGFAAGVILLPLALTSTRGWMRRLGKRWQQLHRLVYLASVLAVIHYVWLVKSDVRVPLLYGAILVFLLLLRLPPIRRAASRVRNISSWLPSQISGMLG
jgi:sulfoxide reductase heme-binding subunit YedZ